MPIPLNNFRGETPKQSRFFRDPRSAEMAVDCDVRTGALRPLHRPQQVASLASSNAGLVALPDGRSFIGIAKPTPQVNARGRSYFIKEGQLKYATGNDASEDFLLGVPQPNQAPTVVATGGTSNDIEERAFFYTLVNSDGEESDPSDVVQLEGKSDATFAITVPAYTENKINELFGERDKSDLKVRIYLGVGLQGRLITEALAFSAGTSVTASYKEGNVTLGETIDVPEHSTLPPTDIKSLAVLRGNFLAATSGDTIYFSEPGIHNRWPATYNRKLSTDILSIVPWVDLLYVFPKDAPPLVVTVPTPDVYSAYDTQIPWPCLSGPSAVNTGLGVVYAARSGMVALQGSRGELITKPILDAESFADFSPFRIRGFSIDGVYQGYGNGKPFTLDTQAAAGLELTERTWNPSDVKVTESIAYGLSEGNVWRHGTTGVRHAFRWVSNFVRFDNPTTMTKVQVRAEFEGDGGNVFPHSHGGIGNLPLAVHPVANPPVELINSDAQSAEVSVTLYNENGDKVTNTRVLEDDQPKSFSMGKHEDVIQVEVVSATTVHSVTVAESGDTLKDTVS